MYSISKSISVLVSRGDILNKTKIASAVACAILVVCATIKWSSSLKTTALRIISAITNLASRKPAWLDTSSSVIHTKKGYKFPEKDKNYKHVMSFLSDKDQKEYGDEEPKMRRENNKHMSQILSPFSFEAEGERFTAIVSEYYIGREVINDEILDSQDMQKVIDKHSLENISIVQKIIYNDVGEESNKSILVRKNPNMEEDKTVRRGDLLRNREWCKAAAESLTKLAGEFIFAIPGNRLRYYSLCELFEKIKKDFSSKGSVNIQQSGFTIEKLLGKDCFTISEDAKVTVMLGSRPEHCMVYRISKEDPTKSFILNYAIIFTLFPYNAKDMLKVIEEDGKYSLSDTDKNFLLAVAKSAESSI
ncbi:MAG: hypothetical protein KAH32_06500 [Chlamydiia bacterium]|nr:hypothetical protein [Chlamydiia bacterium]